MSLRQLFRTRSIESLLREREESGHGWKRVLGARDLVLLGMGLTIGAGIFAMLGTAVAGKGERLGAGPAIVVSLLLTGTACALCALCYAELASLVPVSGSAYTYAYATLGELVAWIIGWDLLLEYTVGTVAVAVSWSGYFCRFLSSLGLEFPAWLASDLRTALAARPDILDAAPRLFGIPVIFNLPAVFIVAAITVVLVLGIRESARLNAVMVAIKLLVLAFFAAVACCYLKPQNWQPFAPNGWAGIQTGAAIMFFAFIGFDAVSTTAEECRNPQRDLPIGIIGSLVICMAIYVAVAVLLTGMIPAQRLATDHPLAAAMEDLNLRWAAMIVALGSVVAHTAVLLVSQLGQPRILCIMARDGLLPAALAKTHRRFKTPHVATIVTGLVLAVGSALADLEEMADLCNIGTLSAFLIVCIAVPVLRWRDPHRPRAFRVPWGPVLPLLGAAACLWLMWGLPRTAWIRFGVWLVLGIVCYSLYGARRSRLRAEGTAVKTST